MTNSEFGDLKNFEEITKDFGEMTSFVLQLIAQICAKTERNKIGADALRKALKLNPFMWQAFADLCHLGENADVNSIFQITNVDVFNYSQGNANTSSMILFGVNGGYDASIQQNSFNLISHNSVGIHEQNLNNSSNYILSTPVEHMAPAHGVGVGGGTALQNLNTPNNNNNYNNLNSSISLLRGNANNIASIQSLGTQNSGLALLDDTPVGYAPEQTSALNNTQQFDGSAGTPFRKQFRYLSTISPTTPSFGVLPINSPCGSDSSFPGFNGALNITNTPSPQTLSEVNQEKAVGRKIKTHVANIMNRKDTTSNNSSANKPAVFTQTGNITPRTPNNTGTPTTGKFEIAIKKLHFILTSGR